MSSTTVAIESAPSSPVSSPHQHSPRSPRRAVSTLSHKTKSAETFRRHSLRLTVAPLEHLPIPPRLVQSPYLNSPESIFQRTASMHKAPSAEDEQWLQDTVPLGFRKHEEVSKPAREETRNEQMDHRVDPKAPMASPPLYRKRSKHLPPATTSPAQSGYTPMRSRSDTHVVTLKDVHLAEAAAAAAAATPTCYFSQQCV